MSKPNDVTTRSIVGRAVVYTVFTVMAAYLIITVIGGILVNLYGAPPGDSVTDTMTIRQRSWCTRTLIALRDELEGQVTLELQHARPSGDPLARWQRWDQGWTRKLGRAVADCARNEKSPFAVAYERLQTMHDGYDEAISQLSSVRVSGRRDLTAAIQRLRWKP